MGLKFGAILFWVAVAVIVGIAAHRRGRDGINWFMVAVLISPPLAGLLVMLLPQKAPFDGEIKFDKPQITQDTQPKLFIPDGIYSGIPYKVTRRSEIEAMMPGGFARFPTMEHFLAAVSEKRAA